MIAPGPLFVVHSVRRRHDGIGRAARRSATGFGIAILMLAWFTLRADSRHDMRPPAVVLAAAGHGVVIWAWTLSRAPDRSPGNYVLPHSNVVVADCWWLVSPQFCRCSPA